MALPVVAIIGRPNVGKSSLLNLLAGQMISIVDPTAGVTRDRVSTLIEVKDRFFELVDTGGYGIEDHDNLTKHVEGQIAQAMQLAQLVLFVVDIREGITTLDKTVAALLRKKKLQVLLVANKADTPKLEDTGGELHALGFGEPLYISAQEGRNREHLLDTICARLGTLMSERPADPVMKFAVVGKRNTGKSTFINVLAGEERVIVSEVAGTTRDAVDVRFERDGEAFIAIDTAGLRKKSVTMNNKNIDFYSYIRATRSVHRADVVLFFIDASMEISQVDKRLAKFIAEEFKPCIIVVNKWDLTKDRQVDTDDYAAYFSKILPGLAYAPVCFITAKEAKNVNEVLDLAADLFKQASTTVSTPKINKVLQIITQERTPSSQRKAGLPKIYYGTQVSHSPPTLMLFVNNPALITDNYQRFLINRLRDHLPFSEIPIRLLLRNHRSEDRPARPRKSRR